MLMKALSHPGRLSGQMDWVACAEDISDTVFYAEAQSKARNNSSKTSYRKRDEISLHKSVHFVLKSI